MEKINVLEKIDRLIEENKYKELYDYISTYFSKINSNEIINIIKYKELLLNKDSDMSKKTKLIEPLKKFLKEKNIQIEDYLKCCDVINLEFNKLNKYKNDECKKMFKYNINVVLINILAKLENYNHIIMNKSNELILNTPENLLQRENLLRQYEYIIEGLSVLLKDVLFFNKDKFLNCKFKNINMFRSNIERCMKKTLKINELCNYVTSIIHLDNMVEQIQEYDVRFINEKLDNVVLFEFKNIDEYKKKAIANKRCGIHDFNHQIEYTSNQESHKKFEEELEKKCELG